MSLIIARSRSLTKLNLMAAIVAGLSLSTALHAGTGDDLIQASFQRMFDHQPVAAATHETSGETDPVQEMVNAALRGNGSGTRNDPVQASFQRMLDHQPVSEAGYTASGETDPVQAMVNAALRSSHAHRAPNHGQALALDY